MSDPSPGLFDDEFKPVSVCPVCKAAGYLEGHAGCYRPLLDPLPEHPFRNSDPETSKMSGRVLVTNRPLRGRLQLFALYLVRMYPGSTEPELFEHAQREGTVKVCDRDTLRPRLSVLADNGYIRRGEKHEWKLNPKTGKWNQTWWPL